MAFALTSNPYDILISYIDFLTPISYGFVTFENGSDAKRVLKEADNLVFKNKKLNIAVAIKKQPTVRNGKCSLSEILTGTCCCFSEMSKQVIDMALKTNVVNMI